MSNLCCNRWRPATFTWFCLPSIAITAKLQSLGFFFCQRRQFSHLVYVKQEKSSRVYASLDVGKKVTWGAFNYLGSPPCMGMAQQLTPPWWHPTSQPTPKHQLALHYAAISLPAEIYCAVGMEHIFHFPFPTLSVYWTHQTKRSFSSSIPSQPPTVLLPAVSVSNQNRHLRLDSPIYYAIT